MEKDSVWQMRSCLEEARNESQLSSMASSMWLEEHAEAAFTIGGGGLVTSAGLVPPPLGDEEEQEDAAVVL
jgi:hypothetical protein